MTNNPIANILPADSIDSLKKGWKLYKPFITPVYRTKIADVDIKVWVAKRQLPFLVGTPWMKKNALIVPVAPDMKMVFGVAKMARDWSGNRAQIEAVKYAPMKPGDVFFASCARHRYAHTILAVIFDEQKRTSPELIRRTVRRGIQVAGERGLTSVILPDMTENLLALPNWITEAQRDETAEVAAFTLVDTLKSCRGMVKTINLWCLDPRNAEFFLRELKRAK